MGPTECRLGTDSQIDNDNELDSDYRHRHPLGPGWLVVVDQLQSQVGQSEGRINYLWRPKTGSEDQREVKPTPSQAERNRRLRMKDEAVSSFQSFISFLKGR
jgi:hypothetical protein